MEHLQKTSYQICLKPVSYTHLINNLAYSYVNKNGVYLVANGKLYVFDENLSSKEAVLDINLTDFSENNDYYYFVDENNNYGRTNKDTKEPVSYTHLCTMAFRSVN